MILAKMEIAFMYFRNYCDKFHFIVAGLERISLAENDVGKTTRDVVFSCVTNYA